MRAMPALVFPWLLLALVVTAPNGEAGTNPEGCALLRGRVNGEFMRGMRECREREVRRRMVGSRCFAKVRAKFDAASGKASVHPWCRIDAGRSEWWQPPTPRCGEAPRGFTGPCWP